MTHEHYLKNVKQYDENIFRILPNADLFYSTCLSFIPKGKLLILELGSGTGYFTSRMLAEENERLITCMDKSADMQKLAYIKNELSDCRFIEADITAGLPDEKYDCIVTTLTLHHIPDDARRQLINEVYMRLNSNGVFICGDVFKPEEDWVEEIYQSRLKKHMRESGMTEEQANSTLTGREKAWPFLDTIHYFYRKLNDSGFSRIFVPLHYDMFGVFVAWR